MFGCNMFHKHQLIKKRKESTEEFTAEYRRCSFSQQKMTIQHLKTLIKKLLELLQVVLSVKLKLIQIHSNPFNYGSKNGKKESMLI